MVANSCRNIKHVETDVESTQSRQKKMQMKSIFLSGSDKGAIVEFIKHV